MKNHLYYFNRSGLPLIPPVAVTDETPVNSGFGRALYLSAWSVAGAVAGCALTYGITWLIQQITNLAFNGELSSHAWLPEQSGLGPAIALIPVIGAIAWWQLRQRSPLASAAGMIIGTGAGAPLGAEGAAMYSSSTGIQYLSRKCGLNTSETTIVSSAVIAAVITWCFGSPLAAIFLAIELFLPVLALSTLLPLGCAVAVAAAGVWLWRQPQYDVSAATPATLSLLGIYVVIGLLTGGLSALLIRSTARMKRLREKLNGQRRWWLLLGPVATGLIGWWAPETLGPGTAIWHDLLHAGVTMQTMMAIACLKLLSWWCYNIALETGTSVLTLLSIGGAWGLTIAFIFQVSLDGITVNPAMAAIVGMFALFAGASRAVLASVIFALEISHSGHLALPVLLACSVAYFVSSFTQSGVRRKAALRA
ncbi:chloride channel protein [Chitinophaga vietnamensis]|uniref:chloride channel protein n=1 Tax=Chitinophaga vietnamensis TaxID=2593957 RepID=UPI0011779D29|nr:chloride channel protein [Chitinophaga vietnamensis]